MNCFGFSKLAIFFYFSTSVPCPVSGWDRTGCQNLVSWQDVKILSRPDLWQDFELDPLSLCPGTMNELLSLFPEGQENPVSLESLNYIEAVKEQSTI